MRWLSWPYKGLKLKSLKLFLLLPLLLLVVGFTSGAQMDADEARQAASSVPEVEKLLSYPTVKASADYDQASDSWHVVLTEEDSQMRVAELSVVDDTEEPETVAIFSPAEALDAVQVASLPPEVQRELAKYDSPYYAQAEPDEEAGGWKVLFVVEDSDPGGGILIDETGEKKAVAQVGVDDETLEYKYIWTGDQIAWQLARGGFTYGRQANSSFLWGIMTFVFALAFIRTDKLLHIRNLDILALVGFLLSHDFFRWADPYWAVYLAVLLWYPPLLYLLVRTLLMGFGIGERVEKTSGFPTPVLFVLATFASGLLFALNLDSGVLDVGYAGVAGADRIFEGVSPYGNMPSDIELGDTYGPLNYLLYAPLVWLFGWSGHYDYLPAAHAMTLLAFVGGALALLFAGWRFAGARGGAALVFAWAVFPYTLWATNQNSNDIIVAAVAAIGLATATSPLARGATVGAGFAIKFLPLVLAPLWALHDFRRQRIAPILKFALGGTVVLLLTFWVLALGGDPVENAKLFYERTFGIQSTRQSPFTIFAQLPALAVLHRPLTVAVIILAFVVAVVPKKRTIRRLAAFSAALIIAFELTLLHWFYAYIIWFEPFVFVALLLATNENTPLDGEKSNRPAAVDYPQKGADGEHPADREESSWRTL
jgi:hypothetical protein